MFTRKSLRKIRRRRFLLPLFLGLISLFLFLWLFSKEKTGNGNNEGISAEKNPINTPNPGGGAESAKRNPNYQPSPNPALSNENLLPCKASNLEGEFFSQPVMAGTMTAGIRFYDKVSAGCTLQGFPEVALFSGGKKVALEIDKTALNDFLGGKMNEKVVLLPKSGLGDGRYPWGVAVLSMAYNYRNAANDTECPNLGYKILKFKITLPDDGGILTVDKRGENDVSNEPFITSICGRIEYGTFEQL